MRQLVQASRTDQLRLARTRNRGTLFQFGLHADPFLGIRTLRGGSSW